MANEAEEILDILAGNPPKFKLGDCYRLGSVALRVTNKLKSWQLSRKAYETVQLEILNVPEWGRGGANAVLVLFRDNPRGEVFARVSDSRHQPWFTKAPEIDYTYRLGQAYLLDGDGLAKPLDCDAGAFRRMSKREADVYVKARPRNAK